MVPAAEEKLAFDVQWRDPRTDITWTYRLNLFPESGEVEMIDLKSRRLFLKRCLPDGPRIISQVLRPGSSLTLLSRQLNVLAYADKFTASKLNTHQQRTLAIIKPDAIQHLAEVLGIIDIAGLLVGELKMCHLAPEEAAAFYAVHRHQPFFSGLIQLMTSGRIVALELLGEDSVSKWRRLIGPTDSETGRREAPESIRALYGTDKTCNACHGSDAAETAAAECAFFFNQEAKLRWKASVKHSSCRNGEHRAWVGSCWGRHDGSLCIVKPHALAARALSPILAVLSQHFHITAAQTCHFTVPSATKLLEVYRGVVPLSEFKGMLDELCSGASVICEVSRAEDGEGAPVEGLRRVCGLSDPALAKALQPETIRARYGEDKARNAVHCTDLAEDAKQEVEFAFSLK